MTLNRIGEVKPYVKIVVTIKHTSLKSLTPSLRWLQRAFCLTESATNYFVEVHQLYPTHLRDYLYSEVLWTSCRLFQYIDVHYRVPNRPMCINVGGSAGRFFSCALFRPLDSLCLSTQLIPNLSLHPHRVPLYLLSLLRPCIPLAIYTFGALWTRRRQHREQLKVCEL